RVSFERRRRRRESPRVVTAIIDRYRRPLVNKPAGRATVGLARIVRYLRGRSDDLRCRVGRYPVASGFQRLTKIAAVLVRLLASMRRFISAPEKVRTLASPPPCRVRTLPKTCPDPAHAHRIRAVAPMVAGAWFQRTFGTRK